MKKKLLCAMVLAVVLVGCITKNPQAGKVDPSTGKPFSDYVADTASLSNAAAAIHGAIAATAPVNPYAGLIDAAAGAVIGLIGAGSAAYASLKKAKAINSTLATGIVKAGVQGSVLETAAYDPHYADIAKHLNDAAP